METITHREMRNRGGEARAARTNAEALATIERAPSAMSSRELIEDSRGNW
ncbi:hypothetical protein [Humibacter sp. RRB41]|nr:hypothetical protein [Humibacter sp. RRB41]